MLVLSIGFVFKVMASERRATKNEKSAKEAEAVAVTQSGRARQEALRARIQAEAAISQNVAGVRSH